VGLCSRIRSSVQVRLSTERRPDFRLSGVLMPMNQLPNITNSHGIAGLRWLLDQAKSWHLSNVELATLLDITTTTLHHWSFEIQAPNNQNFELPASVVERLGLFLGRKRSFQDTLPPS
ncbi:MAG: hypothetical protein KBT85_04470, partial [Pseudomonas sp.]|nr:hypothetical protein [Pseudomonas sp.]